MAESFKNQVDALTGFAGTDDDALSDWLTAGAAEIIHQLPNALKQQCAGISDLDNSTTVMDMDGKGEILYVTRENADSGFQAPCRKIPSMYGGLTTDSSNAIYFATSTDPVYWIESQSGAAKLVVKPTPTSAQPAKVYHISYPTVTHGLALIANFPDGAEYLVALYGAIKALERLMLDQEDQEVYAPQLATLKQDYTQGLGALKGGE